MSKSRDPRRITKASLENIALHYLERFASSAENLRRVLLRRVERSARFHEEDPTEATGWVNDLVVRYQASGLLDDQRYAEVKTRSLHRRGGSLRVIRQHLAARGVDGEAIDAALSDLREDIRDDDASIDPDLMAAKAYARRRRLGPFRLAENRVEHRDRDLAALGRVGFSWEIARKVIDGKDDFGGEDDLG